MGTAMRIRRLKLEQFRNIHSADLGFGDHFNFIVGPNAQGKTNLLEALYYLGGLHSFRSRRSTQLIMHQKDRGLLAAEIQRGKAQYDIRVMLDPQGRRVWFNGKNLVRPDDYYGTLAVVLFTPDDLALLKGGPEGRRNFLDRLIFQVRPGFMRTVLEYRRTLRQRNALLAKTENLDWGDPSHQAYVRELVRLGTTIISARAEMTRMLQPLVAPMVQDVSAGRDAISLVYDCSVTATPGDDEAGIMEAFLDKLRTGFDGDKRTRTTRSGPQRDDLAVTLNDIPLKEHASQGQHRSVVLALKAAEVQILQQRLGAPPVLLLDDLSSELDTRRRQALFHHLLNTAGQVFLTATEDTLSDLIDKEQTRRYSISGGVIQEDV